MLADRKLLASLFCLPAEEEVSQIIMGSDIPFGRTYHTSIAEKSFNCGG